MSDDQVDLLKSKFGKETDLELAAVMGFERSAVAQWRKRGIPKRYRWMLADTTEPGALVGMITDGLRVQFYGLLENQYVVKAALAFFPADLLGEGDTALAGQKREAVLLGLMSLAAQVTELALKKRRCENQADYEAVVALMGSEYRERLSEVISANRVLNQSPQSGT